jgi:hypothetical protein
MSKVSAMLSELVRAIPGTEKSTRLLAEEKGELDGSSSWMIERIGNAMISQVRWIIECLGRYLPVAETNNTERRPMIQ